MSALGDALDRYAGMRRAFGYKFAAPERLLRDFVGFMDARAEAVITSKLGVDWATGTAGPASWPSRLAAVRGFARHLACTEPLTEVPPIGILRQPRRRTPYIYTEQEIGALMDAVLTLPPTKGLRRWTYHYMFGLLAVTGLRIGEALRLKRDDVDFGAGVLTIHDTKFGKSRLVPIHPTTIAALTDYIDRRDARRSRAAGVYFFTAEHGGQIYHQHAHRAFCLASRKIGLKPPPGHGGPRIHDLRHSYAVGTLLRWYRAGEAVEQRLPILSTYLGHTHTRDTYWYLSACPELMEHAARRLDARWEQSS